MQTGPSNPNVQFIDSSNSKDHLKGKNKKGNHNMSNKGNNDQQPMGKEGAPV